MFSCLQLETATIITTMIAIRGFRDGVEYPIFITFFSLIWSNIRDVTVLKGGGDQRFCDDSTKACFCLCIAIHENNE